MASSLLEISILEWLGKFNNLGLPCGSLSDLYSGEVVNAFVHEHLCDGKTFEAVPASQEWLVRKEFWLNLLLKVSRFMAKNPQTIYASVEEQFDALMSELDIESIARKTSTAPLLSLLEIVLACSMQCKFKENCIMQVMQLRKDQQQCMMASIQSVMAKYQKKRSATTSKPSSASSSSSSSSSSTTSHPEINYRERYLTLKQNSETLSKERDSLTDQNAHLLSLINQLETQVASLTTENKAQKAQLEDFAGKQQLSAETAVDLTSPIRFVSSSKVSSQENAHLRSTIAAHEKTITGLQQQLSGLSSYVSRVRELEDEVEMLKEKAHSADQLERVTRKFEAKSTELATALLKVRQLEEQLESVSKASSEFEATSKQVPALKAKLDQYKSELVSLHSKLTEASMSQGNRTSEVEELRQQMQLLTFQVEQHTSIVSALEQEKAELVEALRARPVSQPKSVQSIEGSSIATSSSGIATKKQSLAAEARSTLKTISTGNKQDQQQLAQLEKDLTTAKEETESVKLDLEDKLDTMVRLKDKFQADYVNSSETLRTLREELSRTQSELERATAKNAELTQLHEALNQQIASKQVSFDDLAAKKQALEGQVQTTKQELDRLAGENAALVKKVEAMISQTTSDRVCIDELRTQKQKLETLMAQVTVELEKVKLATSSKEAMLEDELCEARQKVESLAIELSVQQDQTQLVSSDLDEANHAKVELQTEYANLEMEYKTLEETLQEFMDRELKVVETSLTLKSEVQNLNTIIESRDAELTVMQQELVKAKANEELIGVISTLRGQIVAQQKQLFVVKEEQKAIVTSYHAMGMELLQLKMGGLPKPSTKKGFTYTPSKTSSVSTPTKGTTPKRVPLRERSVNQMAAPLDAPAGPCTETSGKTMRRMTMAQRALESRPRSSLAASALAKR